MKQDLRFEGVQEAAYDVVLFASFILFVPVAFGVAVISKLVNVHKVLNSKESTDKNMDARRLAFNLQRLGLASATEREEIKRYIEGWYVNGNYACFLSHFKNEAAAEARVLKLELVRSLNTQEDQIFLDADNLLDLNDLLTDVKESDAIVLLYTKSLLSRPWCLLELVTAVENKVPIILVRIASGKSAGDPSKIEAILEDLGGYLAKSENPTAEATLTAFGTSAAAVASTIKSVLVKAAMKDNCVTFDPHQSSRVMHAAVQQLAQALVRDACPENKPLLADIIQAEPEPWESTREFAVFIVHEQTIGAVEDQAKLVKDWLLRRSGLDPSKVEIQGHGQERNESQDAAIAADKADCVLLLQSANCLREPRCLASLSGAAEAGIPIVPVVLLPSSSEQQHIMYSFDTAKPHLQSLAGKLEPAGECTLANDWCPLVAEHSVHISCCFLDSAAPSRLRSDQTAGGHHRPSGRGGWLRPQCGPPQCHIQAARAWHRSGAAHTCTSVIITHGAPIANALICVPLASHAQNEIDTQMAEIERTLRQRSAEQRTAPPTPKAVIIEPADIKVAVPSTEKEPLFRAENRFETEKKV